MVLLTFLLRWKKQREILKRHLNFLVVFPVGLVVQDIKKQNSYSIKKVRNGGYYLNYNYYMLCDFSINKLLKMIWYAEKSFDEKVKSTLKIAEWLKDVLEQTNYEMLYRPIETMTILAGNIILRIET